MSNSVINAQSSVPEAEILKQRLDALARETEGLKNALSWSRTIRLLSLLAIVGMVLVTCYLFYGLGSRLQSKKYLDELQTKAQKQLEARSPDYLRHLQQLTEDSAPVLGEAFSAQFQKDLPLFMKAVEKEGTGYRENVQKALLKRLDGHTERSLEKHRKVIETEVLAIDKKANPQRIEANLNKAVHTLIERYQVAELQRQLDALGENWEKMPAAAPTKGELPPQEQFTGSLLTLLKYRLTIPPTTGQP
jgi:hypothetical protein